MIVRYANERGQRVVPDEHRSEKLKGVDPSPGYDPGSP